MTRRNADEWVRLVEHLHVAFVYFRTHRTGDRDAVEQVSHEHVTGFEGECFRLRIDRGSEISLVGADSSGERCLEPFVLFPLQALQRGLAVGGDVAGEKSQPVAQLSFIEKDSHRIVAGCGVEESSTHPC